MSKKEKNLPEVETNKERFKKRKKTKLQRVKSPAKRDIMFLNGSFYKYCKDQEDASFKVLGNINRRWAKWITVDPFEKYLEKLNYESDEIFSFTEDQKIRALITRILCGEYPLSFSRILFGTSILKTFPFVNLLYDDPIAVKSVIKYGIKTRKDMESVRRFINLYRYFSGGYDIGFPSLKNRFGISFYAEDPEEETIYQEGFLDMLCTVKDSADYGRNFDIRNCDCAMELEDKMIKVAYIDFGDILVTLANLMSNADKLNDAVLTAYYIKSISEFINRLILPISINSCITIECHDDNLERALNNEESCLIKTTKYTNIGREYLFNVPSITIDKPTKGCFNDLIDYFSYVYTEFTEDGVIKKYYPLNELPIQAFDKWILYTNMKKEEGK